MRILKSIKTNLINKKFGRLLVLNFDHWADRNERGVRIPYWNCVCECGKFKICNEYTLKDGMVKSCGCLIKERSRANGFKNIKKDTALNSVIRTYKSSAKKRGLKFELNKEQFKFLTQQNCEYCGDPPKNIRIKPRRSISHLVLPYIYNGIDRVDNSVGYELSNCVTCCYHCNTMKMHFTKEEFLRKVELIYLKLIYQIT